MPELTPSRSAFVLTDNWIEFHRFATCFDYKTRRLINDQLFTGEILDEFAMDRQSRQANAIHQRIRYRTPPRVIVKIEQQSPRSNRLFMNTRAALKRVVLHGLLSART